MILKIFSLVWIGILAISQLYGAVKGDQQGGAVNLLALLLTLLTFAYVLFS
jgi:hypothetical protein